MGNEKIDHVNNHTETIAPKTQKIRKEFGQGRNFQKNKRAGQKYWKKSAETGERKNQPFLQGLGQNTCSSTPERHGVSMDFVQRAGATSERVKVRMRCGFLVYRGLVLRADTELL